MDLHRWAELTDREQRWERHKWCGSDRICSLRAKEQHVSYRGCMQLTSTRLVRSVVCLRGAERGTCPGPPFKVFRA